MGRASSISALEGWGQDADRTPRTFVRQELTGRIVLDNSRFVGCTFNKAVLIYSAEGPTQIDSCTFNDVSFAFEGAAGLTLALLKAMANPKSGLSEVVKASFPQMFGH